MRHSVAFKCADDAKKNDPNVYFHMEPGENRPEVRKQWIYAMDLRNGFRFSPGSIACGNIYSDPFSLHH